MPRLIDPGPVPGPIGLDRAVEALVAMRFDSEDDEAWDAAAPILAALSADRRFLGDIAVAALIRGDDTPGIYGPPVIMLHRGAGNWFLRANLWPAEEDAVLRASGRRAFFYDLPHDHNFSFLTIGHHGPGYESDHWEVAAAPRLRRADPPGRVRACPSGVCPCVAPLFFCCPC